MAHDIRGQRFARLSCLEENSFKKTEDNAEYLDNDCAESCADANGLSALR